MQLISSQSIGFGLGLFKSFFQSVSAFCNAGFDLIGNSSMMPFVTHKITNFTCMFLITVGGLGFLVWDDMSNCIREGFKRKYSITKVVKTFNLHTKLVLIIQVILILVGAITFYIFESENINTIGKFGIFDKWMISTFHSISARTAGFASVDLASLNEITKMIMIILMFIGGAPGGMAGGVKTTTIFVLILGVISNVRGKKNINIMQRTITSETFIKAVSVIVIAVLLLVSANMFFVANSDINELNLLFESVSGFATVGLTSGALAQMSTVNQSIIILLMYIGRVGTTTMAVAFVMKKPRENDLVVYAKGNIIVG